MFYIYLYVYIGRDIYIYIYIDRSGFFFSHVKIQNTVFTINNPKWKCTNFVVSFLLRSKKKGKQPPKETHGARGNKTQAGSGRAESSRSRARRRDHSGTPGSGAAAQTFISLVKNHPIGLSGEGDAELPPRQSRAVSAGGDAPRAAWSGTRSRGRAGGAAVLSRRAAGSGKRAEHTW